MNPEQQQSQTEVTINDHELQTVGEELSVVVTIKTTPELFLWFLLLINFVFISNTIDFLYLLLVSCFYPNSPNIEFHFKYERCCINKVYLYIIINGGLLAERLILAYPLKSSRAISVFFTFNKLYPYFKHH